LTFEGTVVFIAILGVLVFFHEWGHFIAAKLSGITVEEFAFGFGPKLVRLLRRGDTDYTIHAVPLGGFVKLTGMEPGEEDVEGGYQAQPVWKRAAVIFAGPLFSFVLGAAVLLFVGIHWGFPNHTVLPRVGRVEPQTEAARVDLRAGDRVLEINGVRITSGGQMTDIIHGSPGRELTLLIDRDGSKLTKTARPRWVVTYLDVDWSFMAGPMASVLAVAEPSAAAKAGIERDDVLVSINDRAMSSGPEMIAAIKAGGDRPARLVIKKGGKLLPVEIKPELQWVRFIGMKWIYPEGIATRERLAGAAGGILVGDVLASMDGRKIKSGQDLLEAAAGAGGREVSLIVKRDGKSIPVVANPAGAPVEGGSYIVTGLLGFQPAPHLVKAGLGESIREGLQRIAGMLGILAKTLTSKRIAEEVGGPVLIWKVTQSYVALGPNYVLGLLGSLSLGLAIINLIPIPAVLDGGHLILLGIEAVRRKRWSRSQMQAMQTVGLAVVFVLFVLIFAADITKIATGQVPQ